MREAFQRQHPTHLGGSVQPLQQIVQVALKPPFGPDDRRLRLGYRHPPVKLRDPSADRLHGIRLERTAVELGRQRVRLVEPAHLDDVVHRPRV